MAFVCEKCERRFDTSAQLFGHKSACGRRRKVISKMFQPPKYARNGIEVSVPPRYNMLSTFRRYDRKFFGGILYGKVKLCWRDFALSRGWERTYARTYPIRPGHPDIEIHLNWFLLEGQPMPFIHSQLVHEMIHAYLIHTKTEGRHHHGKPFKEQMNRINLEDPNLHIEIKPSPP